MSVKLQKKVLNCEEEDKGDPIAVLLNVSKISTNCICLRGTIKLENAFGQWGCEQSLDVGGYQSGHICTGGFIIDCLKQQKNSSYKPVAPKRNPKPAKHFLGYVPSSRTGKHADNRNIAAFKHLSSYEEYADYYRMSKTEHCVDLVNPHEKQAGFLGFGVTGLVLTYDNQLC